MARVVGSSPPSPTPSNPRLHPRARTSGRGPRTPLAAVPSGGRTRDRRDDAVPAPSDPAQAPASAACGWRRGCPAFRHDTRRSRVRPWPLRGGVHALARTSGVATGAAAPKPFGDDGARRDSPSRSWACGTRRGARVVTSPAGEPGPHSHPHPGPASAPTDTAPCRPRWARLRRVRPGDAPGGSSLVVIMPFPPHAARAAEHGAKNSNALRKRC